MAHTFANLLTHVIFSTKDRQPLISRDLKPDLLAYMGGIVCARPSGAEAREVAAHFRHDFSVKCQYIVYMVCQDILYTSSLVLGVLGPGGSQDPVAALASFRSTTRGRVRPCFRSISRMYICR